jgi:hypothetical protein
MIKAEGCPPQLDGLGGSENKLFGSNVSNIFYLKTGFPWCFGLVIGTSGKYCQYLLFENGISVFFWIL